MSVKAFMLRQNMKFSGTKPESNSKVKSGSTLRRCYSSGEKTQNGKYKLYE